MFEKIQEFLANLPSLRRLTLKLKNKIYQHRPQITFKGISNFRRGNLLVSLKIPPKKLKSFHRFLPLVLPHPGTSHISSDLHGSNKWQLTLTLTCPNFQGGWIRKSMAFTRFLSFFWLNDIKIDGCEKKNCLTRNSCLKKFQDLSTKICMSSLEKEIARNMAILGIYDKFEGVYNSTSTLLL